MSSVRSVRSVTKNAGVLFIAKGISALLIFIYTVSMARYLGAKGFGIISFALAFTGIFGIIADLGLQLLIIREVARNRNLVRKYLNNVLGIKLILSVITFLLVVLCVSFLEYSEDVIYVIYLIALYVLFNSFNNLFYGIYQAFEKLEYVGIGYLINNFLILFGVFIGIYLRFSVVNFAYVYLCSGLLVFMFNLIILTKKIVKPGLDIDLSFWRYLIKEAISFGLMGIFIVIYFRIDSVMLGIIKSSDIVGLYNAAYRIIDGLNYLIPSVIFATLYPVMSKYFKSFENLKKIYIKSLQVSFIVGLVISTFITLFAEKIVLLVYGSAYINSAMPLKILTWAFFIICISTVTSGLLNSINKQKIVTFGTGLGALINIILNLLLIPKYSMRGAALATVITEIIGFLIYFYFIKKYLNLSKYDIISIFRFSKYDLKVLRNFIKDKNQN